MPSYKSFCWSLGTTSFRMVEFNRKIEKQLELLDEFWHLPQNQSERWAENEIIQISYYNFLKEKDFIDGNAPRKAKDARGDGESGPCGGRCPPVWQVRIFPV